LHSLKQIVTSLGRHRSLEVFGIGLAAALLALVAVRSVAAIRGWWDVAALALTVVAGHVVADLMSGIAHWAGDTLGSPETPIVGRHFIAPFRQHHCDPRDITRHDFVETNGNSCIALAPLLLFAWLATPADAGPQLWLAGTLASTCAWLIATNQFHKWAHLDRAPRIARLLQAAHLAIRPAHHGVHHRAPHDAQYCITSGIMNPVLARVRLFRRLEAWLSIRPERRPERG
jgi:ubiquitin-conjugating enzyme E2 variant